MIRVLFLTVLLWLLYIVSMKLRDYAESLGGWGKHVAYAIASPFFIVGYVLDIFLNLTLFSVVFWQLPRLETLSQRLSRILEGERDWRYEIANWICETLLHPFDEDHCE